MLATGAAAAVGAASAIWPFISQMNPDSSTIAAGSPIDVDISAIAAGQIVTIKWRGKPIFVRHRTEAEITEAKKTPMTDLIDPASDAQRVPVRDGKAAEEWVVVYGICTHLGCVPIGHAGPFDGWYCPCHGSQYDSAGRVRHGPAPRNLDVAPVAFLSDSKIRIG